MPTSIFRPPRPRTSGGLLPLPQEWERWRNKLDHEAPLDHPTRASLNLPCDWHSVDRLQDDYYQVLAEKQAPPVQDAMTALKQDEWRLLLERYHLAWVALKEERKEVRKIAHLKAVRLMNILPDDWNSREFPPVSLSVSDIQIFSSFQEAKATIDAFTPTVLCIEEYVHKLGEVQGFWNDPDRTYYMLIKALERIESLEAEVFKQSNRKAA